MGKHLAYILAMLFFIALVAAIAVMWPDAGNIITTVLFWGVFVSIGMISSFFYKSANIDKLKKTVASISIISAMGSAYLLSASIYFAVPVAIILLPLLFYRGGRVFFGMSFLLSFVGFVSFVYMVFEMHVTGAIVLVSLLMLFNSLLSIVAYIMKSYRDLASPLKRTKEKSYVLKPPASWFIVPIVFLLFALLGVYAALSPDVNKGPNEIWMFTLYVVLMFALVAVAGRTLNKIAITKDSIIVQGMVFPRKISIKISNIKKAEAKTVPAAYGYNTVLLRVHTKKGVETVDIRTNYNYRDTIQFMSVAKNILGKRFRKAK